MQVFELLINPKSCQMRMFDSFVYEPENIYEKKLGSLYLLGDMDNCLPQNSRLMENLFQIIKKKYYNFSFKSNEKALTEGLKKANDYLSEEIKKDNTSWLGNLNFAGLSIKDSNLTFSFTGNLKILLLRGGQVTDIGKNLMSEDIDPYPLKVFFNIVSGKLLENDKILVLTEEIYNFFEKQNILSKITKAGEIDRRSIKRIVPASLLAENGKKGKNKEEKITGICQLIMIKSQGESRKPIREVISQNEENLIFAKFLSPARFLLLSPDKLKRKFVKIFKNKFGAEKNFWGIFLEKSVNILKISYGKIVGGARGLIFLMRDFQWKSTKRKPIKIKIKEERTGKQLYFDFIGKSGIYKWFTPQKRLIAFSLLIIAIIGFAFLKSKPEENKKTAENSAKLEIRKDSAADAPIPEGAKLLSNINLKNIGFEPKNILNSGSALYFYSPSSGAAYIYDLKSGTDGKIELEDNFFGAGALSGSSALFFSKPNNLAISDGDTLKEATFPNPFGENKLNLFSIYSSNLYFWDQGEKEILKSSFVKNNIWDSVKVWTKKKPGNPVRAKALAAEESIWILTDKNLIDRYYKGEYKESINIEAAPAISNPTRLLAKKGLPYLLLLEPANKRVLVINKNGKAIKQVQGEKFSALNDFSLSGDGKTLWVLNGLDVYEIKI